MIPITKPFLPPIDKYEELLKGIWERDWLTNMGPLANQLESRLKKHLGLTNILYVTSGTVALQMAIKALDLKGVIITTPFSFIATTSAIVWENCTPVFVDINPDSLTIDVTKIESAITDKTEAILATHVYGNPCDIEAIEKIAKKHKLKVIYDGAHAFGVEYKGKSVFEYGDISICSLHATKLYHSTEGGLIITKDPELSKKIYYMRNFGFNGPDNFSELGLNGKNSEFHAAMGLVNLKYIQDIHEQRKALTEFYHSQLESTLSFIPKWNTEATLNYAYYPIIFESEEIAMACFDNLKKEDIYARRYFYPSLSSILPYMEPKSMPITDEIANRVLCLPLYYDLTIEDVTRICTIIKKYAL